MPCLLAAPGASATYADARYTMQRSHHRCSLSQMRACLFARLSPHNTCTMSGTGNVLSHALPLSSLKAARAGTDLRRRFFTKENMSKVMFRRTFGKGLHLGIWIQTLHNFLASVNQFTGTSPSATPRAFTLCWQPHIWNEVPYTTLIRSSIATAAETKKHM